MATNSLGRLTLDLVVQTASFSEPLSRAERQARTSSQGIANSLNIAAIAVSALSGAVAGLSVAQLVNYSDRVIQAGNDIQKFSKLANASVRDFQYYAKGAETAGISMESFADKMKDMQDRIGDFQQTGGGPLADFFTNIAPKVGVTIQQFQKLSGPDALQLFYNSLEKAGASTNDMKFYMEAIISDSSLLIPLLENGGEGFKKWGDAAERAGAIMSDDLVKSLAQARENLQLMDLQWQGVEARLVNSVVPAIETVIENWDDIKAVTIAVSAGIATRFVPALVMATYQLGQTALFAVRAGVGLANFARTAGATTSVMALLGGPAGIGMLLTQLAVAGGAYYLMSKQTQDATDALEDQGLIVDELREKYKKLTASQLALKSIEAGEEIDKQTKQLKSLFIALEQFENDLRVQGDTKQLTGIQNYLKSLKEGGDKAKTAFSELQKQGLVSETTLKFIAELDTKINEANNSIDRQKEIQNLVKNATNDTTKAQQDQAKAVNDSAKAWMSLTQKQREYITQAKQDVLREGYIKTLVREGVSVDKANVYADAQIAANGENAFKAPLPKDVLLAARENFNLKNYTFSKDQLAAIARAQGIAKTNNFAQIESLYGLPAGTLAALILQESGANAGAKSRTGAIGLFQTTSVFRKQYGLNSKSSIEEVATAAAKDLQKHYQEFGDRAKALMAYNAGAGGLRTYLKGGLSDSKRKEVAGYVPGFQKWFAGVSGKSTVDNSILMPTQADILQQNANIAQAAFELSEKRKEVDSQYYSESEKLAKEHQDRIDKITQVYTGTDQLKTRLAQEDVLYKEQVTQLEVSRQQELNQLKAFETDRISQIRESYDEEIRLMQVSTKYVGAERSKRLELLERAKQAEIDAVKREEEERVQSAFESYLNETDIVVNRYKREREEIQKNYQLTKETREKLLQANQMGVDSVLLKNSQKIDDMLYQSLDYVYRRNQPNKAAWTDLENQYYGQQGALNKAYSEQRGGIFSAVDDENERNAQLLAAHEQYLQAKAALDADYAQKERDLDQQNFETKMQVYSQIAGMTGQVFSDMTTLLEQSVGKSNALYKTMFFASKAASIAQAIVNTEEGATKALAQGGAYGSVLAGVVRATGYASVGIMAAQTIQGMAHNGIDNIPREGTWLLDGGERVLNPQQNKDLTNYLNNRQNGSSEGNVQISQQITFADGSASVNTQGQKQIAESLNNAMDAWARRESRQGGVLFNLVRR